MAVNDFMVFWVGKMDFVGRYPDNWTYGDSELRSLNMRAGVKNQPYFLCSSSIWM